MEKQVKTFLGDLLKLKGSQIPVNLRETGCKFSRNWCVSLSYMKDKKVVIKHWGKKGEMEGKREEEIIFLPVEKREYNCPP